MDFTFRVDREGTCREIVIDRLDAVPHSLASGFIFDLMVVAAEKHARRMDVNPGQAMKWAAARCAIKSAHESVVLVGNEFKRAQAVICFDVLGETCFEKMMICLEFFSLFFHTSGIQWISRIDTVLH